MKPSERRLTREQLIGLALQLGARRVAGWSDAEEILSKEAVAPTPLHIAYFRDLIKSCYFKNVGKGIT